MSSIYFAKWILLPDGNILENGGVSVDSGVITSTGRRGHLKRSRKDRLVNLGDSLLLPGLVNMHTHLEEGVIRDLIKEDNESYTSWINKRMDRMSQAPPEKIISSVRLNIWEALANGTTTIVDTSSRDISPIVLRDEPVNSWIIHEIPPFFLNLHESEPDILSILQKRIKLSQMGINPGIGPYSIYSMSPEDHKKLIAFTNNNKLLWASHMAENSEELQAFSENRGPLYHRLTEKGPWPYGETRYGSMYYAITNNLIPNRSICYHCNYASGQELSLLSAKKTTIVLCYQYSKAMGHKHFPVDAARRRGINLCLGTESPSSQDPMDLFDELFQIKMAYPYIPAEELIKWVTQNPCNALGIGNICGSLEQGKRADIIGVRFPQGSSGNILEEMLLEQQQISFVMVNGEEIIVDK